MVTQELAEVSTELFEKIHEIVKSKMPEGSWFKVREQTVIGDPMIYISIAASPYEINDVAGQHPQRVGLQLGVRTMRLDTVNIGGMGERSVYLHPDLNDEREKYLAMAGRNVPFRRPKPNEKAVLAAIERFIDRWFDALREHRARLKYDDVVDYDKLLS